MSDVIVIVTSVFKTVVFLHKFTIIGYKFIMIKFFQCDELQTSLVTNVAVYVDDTMHCPCQYY